MKPVILVVGSSNTDMVIQADHLPVPGETVLGGRFFMTPGGKGANQAVAAARLAGNVCFICKTGNDIFGKQSLQLFKGEGIDISHAVSDPDNPSGVALITVDKNAENCIVVASGANATLRASDLESATQTIRQSSILLMQLEIPLDTVSYVATIAAQHQIKVILNPAPACILSDDLLGKISILTPNQSEAEMLTGLKIDGVETAKQAALMMFGRGVPSVIITLGINGSLVYHEERFTHIPAHSVTAVDTTAAGDVFSGALAVALSEGRDILDATRFASVAAAISVTRPGAQSSIPDRKEVDTFSQEKHQH